MVINRVLSSVYPSTLSGVIYQNRQFEPVSTGRLALALAENRATASCYRAADEGHERRDKRRGTVYISGRLYRAWRELISADTYFINFIKDTPEITA